MLRRAARDRRGTCSPSILTVQCAYPLQGQQGPHWKVVHLTIYSAAFRFEYSCGAGAYGDAAVAQVALTCGIALPPLPP
eukprot:4042221-Prymnesium_polylepis.1